MKSNFNNKNNKNNRKPKPVFLSLPIIFSGLDKNGNEYDVDSAKKILAELQNDNVFSKLSVSVGINKSLVEGEDAKGTLTVARIQSIDEETMDAQIMLFNNNTKYEDIIKEFVIVPHVRTGRDSNEVISILRFEIVQAMDA